MASSERGWGIAFEWDGERYCYVGGLVVGLADQVDLNTWRASSIAGASKPSMHPTKAEARAAVEAAYTEYIASMMRPMTEGEG